jgi:hypothetical protein
MQPLGQSLPERAFFVEIGGLLLLGHPDVAGQLGGLGNRRPVAQLGEHDAHHQHQEGRQRL